MIKIHFTVQYTFYIIIFLKRDYISDI